jgi:hypothetical protein
LRMAHTLATSQGATIDPLPWQLSERSMKSFFVFLGVLLASGIAFGFYISTLASCAVMAGHSNSAFTEIECHKLYLAFGVLFAIAIMLALGAGIYALIPPHQGSTDNPGKNIFENFAKILPPIITLVLGYYFGSTQTAHPAKESTARSAVASASSASDAASTASKK